MRDTARPRFGFGVQAGGTRVAAAHPETRDLNPRPPAPPTQRTTGPRWGPRGIRCPAMPTADLLSAVHQTRYPLEAFLFVQRGLDWTVRSIHGDPDDDASLQHLEDPEESPRHVSGRELCGGLRKFAIHQYGLMAAAVLRNWGITRCEDFGHIVFAMVDAGLMHKNADDSIADFENVFEFRNAFGRFELDLTTAPL